MADHSKAESGAKDPGAQQHSERTERRGVEGRRFGRNKWTGRAQRSNRRQLITNLWHVLRWAYGLQAFIVVPWLLGATYRGEQSMWVGTEAARSVERFGNSDAALTWYLYAIFYGGFVLVPYGAFAMWGSDPNAPALVRERPQRKVAALWAGATFALLWRPLFAFLHALPETWNGWLVILWMATTVWLMIRYRRTSRKQTSS